MIKNKQENTIAKKKSSRIASLDFFRGLAIVFMLIYHVIMHIYDYEWLTDYNQLLEVNIIILILMGLAAFFGTWHGFFLFISAIVNAYVIIKKKQKNQSSKSIISKQVFTGSLLIFLGWFEQAFGYDGYFGKVIRGGSWTNFSPLYGALFEADTLKAIGFCLIVNSILLTNLLSNNNELRFKRNMSIFLLLSVIIFVTTALLRHFIPTFSWLYDETPGSMINLTSIAKTKGTFAAWFLAITTGGLVPIFPFLGTSFIGTMIGLCLANPKITKKTPLWWIISGLGFMILGGLLIGFNAPFTTIEVNAALSTYFIRLGGQIMVIWAVLYFIEFNKRGEQFANNVIVRFFRLWGIVSLTIYLFQIFVYVPRLLQQVIFGGVFNINFMDDHVIPRGQELLIVLTLVFVLVIFHGIIYLWSKINFIGSLEWSITQLQNITLPRTQQKRKKFDVNQLMNNVHWIAFPLSKKEDSDESIISLTPDKNDEEPEK